MYPQTFCCGFKSLRVHTYADSLRFRASTRVEEQSINYRASTHVEEQSTHVQEQEYFRASTHVEEQSITSPTEMSEAFNNYFASVGKNLSDEIPSSENEPEVYLNPTDKRFSLKAPTVDTVCNLLRSIDEKKSVGLDKIPNKLLKIAANVVAPSLTAIFTASICTGIFPQEWKASRVSPVYKSGIKNNPSNY